MWYIIRRKDHYEDEERLSWLQALFKRPRHRVIRTEWTFLWIKNQLKVQANTLKSLGEIVDESEYVRKCKFVYEGNIYDRYNAESGRLYWLQGIKDYFVEMHPSEIPTRDAVDDYCKRNARRAENGEKAEE